MICNDFEIIVIGAGHAGCEAALAAARLGKKVLVFTVSVDSIALMPCNPNIGGTSKGHLVKEVDALGGEMGQNIDKTYIQSKMLNKSKGPAVHSLRAQADKQAYSLEMRKVMENTPNLTIKQAEVAEILVEEGRVTGVKTYSGAVYTAKAVILCTGTYLKARCIYGDVSEYTGPNGLSASTHLTDSLFSLGMKLRRFKTGTPARVDKRTIDFSKMEVQNGDEKVVPFSFLNEGKDISREQIPCHLTYTNEETHRIIRENIERSPLYGGVIEGVGPRYCPSIEDKVMRFADKERHQIFVEPEGEYTNEMYVDGMSSSMPEDVQVAMYRTIPGLENVHIVRNAYAIEYDCVDATTLKESLETKVAEGLYAAGQFNGSSGYEEAAAQGLIAGINAVRKLDGKEPLILKRSDAYIGVLIDDLVTKHTKEPYRMMTSRAEYRLLLRQDNADLRLTKIGYEVGLISKERYEALLKKEAEIEEEIKRLKSKTIGGKKEVNDFLVENGSTPLLGAVTLADLIKRPELNYEALAVIDDERPKLSEAVGEQVNINIKYEGYIERQREQVAKMNKLEQRLLPDSIDYEAIDTISSEGRQKLSDIRPRSLGQASRISGVSPADITALLIYTEQMKREGKGNVSM